MLLVCCCGLCFFNFLLYCSIRKQGIDQSELTNQNLFWDQSWPIRIDFEIRVDQSESIQRIYLCLFHVYMDFVKWVWYQWLLILVENLFILKLRKVSFVLKVYGLWLKDSKKDRLLWTIVSNIKKSTSTALLSVAPDIWGIAAIEIVKYILSFDEEFSRFYASIFTIACASLGLSGCRRTRKPKVWTALSRYCQVGQTDNRQHVFDMGFSGNSVLSADILVWVDEGFSNHHFVSKFMFRIHHFMFY